MAGYPAEKIKSMTAQAIECAVRSFKDRFNNEFIPSTLYGNPVRDFEHAYEISETIEHDNNYKNLHVGSSTGKKEEEYTKQKYKNHHSSRSLYYQNQHYKQQNFPKPEPIDKSSATTRNFNKNLYNTRQQHNPQVFHSQPWKNIEEKSGILTTTKNFNVTIEQRQPKIEVAKSEP